MGQRLQITYRFKARLCNLSTPFAAIRMLFRKKSFLCSHSTDCSPSNVLNGFFLNSYLIAANGVEQPQIVVKRCCAAH